MEEFQEGLVHDVVALSGFSMLDGQGSNFGTCYVVLHGWDERAATGRSVDAIMGDIRAQLGPIQEASFQVLSLPAIRGLGNTQGFDLRILDQGSLGRGALQTAVDDLVATDRAQTRLQSA